MPQASPQQPPPAGTRSAPPLLLPPPSPSACPEPGVGQRRWTVRQNRAAPKCSTRAVRAVCFGQSLQLWQELACGKRCPPSPREWTDRLHPSLDLCSELPLTHAIHHRHRLRANVSADRPENLCSATPNTTTIAAAGQSVAGLTTAAVQHHRPAAATATEDCSDGSAAGTTRCTCASSSVRFAVVSATTDWWPRGRLQVSHLSPKFPRVLHTCRAAAHDGHPLPLPLTAHG